MLPKGIMFHLFELGPAPSLYPLSSMNHTPHSLSPIRGVPSMQPASWPPISPEGNQSNAAGSEVRGIVGLEGERHVTRRGSCHVTRAPDRSGTP